MLQASGVKFNITANVTATRGITRLNKVMRELVGVVNSGGKNWEKFLDAVGRLGSVSARVSKITEKQAGSVQRLSKATQQETKSVQQSLSVTEKLIGVKQRAAKAADQLGTAVYREATAIQQSVQSAQSAISVHDRLTASANKAGKAMQRLGTGSASGRAVVTSGAAGDVNKRLAGQRVEPRTDKIKAATQAMHTYTTAVYAAQHAVMALGAAWATWKLGHLIKETTLLAGRVENLRTIMYNVGVNAGYTHSELDVLEGKIRKLGITTRHTREAMTLLARNNLDVAKGFQLARIAQDAAVIAGENSSEAYEKLAIAIQRLDTRLLRNRGILINLRNLYQQVAVATGRVETTLTAAEKQEILLNEVIRKGVQTMGTYESAMNDVFKQYTSLVRYTEEAARVFGEQFLPVFEVVVKTMTGFFKWFSADDRHRGWHLAAAGAASFVAILGTLTTVVLGAKLAMSAYTLAVLASKAAMDAAKVSYLAMTVAMAKNPLTLVVLALSAVATGLVMLAANARSAKQELEDLKSEAAETAVSLHGLQRAYRRMDELSAKGDSSRESLLRQKMALEDLKAVARDTGIEISDLASEEETLQTLREQGIGIEQTSAETAAQYNDAVSQQRVEVNRLAKEIQELGKQERAQYAQWRTGRGSFGGYNRMDSSQMRSLKEQWRQSMRDLAVLEDKHTAYMEVASAERIRITQKALDEQHVAYQLALRAENALHRERAKMFKDEGLEILDTLDEYGKKLRTVFVSEEQIFQQAADRWETQRKKIAETFKEKRDQAANATELAEVETQEAAALRQIHGFIRSEMSQELRERIKIKNVMEDKYELAKLLREEQEREVGYLKERLDLEEQGVDSDTISVLQELRKELFRRQQAMDEYNRRLGVDTKETEQIERRRQEIRAEIADYEQRAKAIEDAEKSASTDAAIEAAVSRRIAINKERGAVEALQQELDLLNVQYDESSKTLAERIDIARQAAAEDEKNALLQAKLNDLLFEQEEAVKNLDVAKRKSAQVVREILRDYVTWAKEAAEDRKESHEEAIDDLVGIEDKLTRKTWEAAKERIEARKKEYESVQDFIRKIQLDLLEGETPGTKEIMSLADSFIENVKKAGDDEQLNLLEQMFPKKMRQIGKDYFETLRELQNQIVEQRRKLVSSGDVKDAIKLREMYFEYVQLRERGVQLNKLSQEQTKRLTEEIATQRGLMGDRQRQAKEDQALIDAEVKKRKETVSLEKELYEASVGVANEAQRWATAVKEGTASLEDALAAMEKLSGTAKDWGMRPDGTQKGDGFLGPLQLPGGGVATEYSIGVGFDGKEMDIPTLVPTLTDKELEAMVNDIIPNQKMPPEAIIRKAVEHARDRMAQGLPVFAGPGADKPGGGFFGPPTAKGQGGGAVGDYASSLSFSSLTVPGMVQTARRWREKTVARDMQEGQIRRAQSRLDARRAGIPKWAYDQYYLGQQPSSVGQQPSSVPSSGSKIGVPSRPSSLDVTDSSMVLDRQEMQKAWKAFSAAGTSDDRSAAEDRFRKHASFYKKGLKKKTSAGNYASLTGGMNRLFQASRDMTESGLSRAKSAGRSGLGKANWLARQALAGGDVGPTQPHVRQTPVSLSAREQYAQELQKLRTWFGVHRSARRASSTARSQELRTRFGNQAQQVRDESFLRTLAVERDLKSPVANRSTASVGKYGSIKLNQTSYMKEKEQLALLRQQRRDGETKRREDLRGKHQTDLEKLRTKHLNEQQNRRIQFAKTGIRGPFRGGGGQGLLNVDAQQGQANQAREEADTQVLGALSKLREALGVSIEGSKKTAEVAKEQKNKTAEDYAKARDVLSTIMGAV